MSNTPATLICFAVKEEAKFYPAGGQRNIRVLVTGMGRRNADQAIRQAIDAARPELVLTTGFAGGLNPDLKYGTVLFAAENQLKLHSRLLAAGALPARFICREKVATTAKEKFELYQQTGADAVEMESEIIISVCRAQKIPVATVRVILDVATEDLPLDFNTLMDENKVLSKRKLAVALLKAPATVVGLLRLRKQSQVVARRLAEVLSQIL